MLTTRESNLIDTFRKRKVSRDELMAERHKARQSGRDEYEDAILALMDEMFELHETKQYPDRRRVEPSRLIGIKGEGIAPKISRNSDCILGRDKNGGLDKLSVIRKALRPVSESNEYIYILSNESMPGLIKIGKTRTNPMQRKEELQSTGVPTPFVIEFSARVIDCNYAEKIAHQALSRYRISKSREFFRIPITDALLLFLPAIGEYEVASCANPHDIREVEEVLVRRVESEKIWREEMRQKAIQDNFRKVQRGVSAYKASCEPILAEISIERRNMEELGPRPKRSFVTSLCSLTSGAFYIFGMLSIVPFFWSFGSGSKISTINILAYAVVGFLNGWLLEEIGPKKYSKAVEPFLVIDQRIRILNNRLREHENTLRDRLPSTYSYYSLEEILRLSDSSRSAQV